MKFYKSSGTNTSYYRMRDDETPPNGYAKFIVRVTDRETHFHLTNHFIATESLEDAKKVVDEDYQTQGRGFLVI